MKTRSAILLVACLGLGAKVDCGGSDPGGIGGSTNLGGSESGGTVVVDAGSVGGSVIVDSGPAPCANACCTTCQILASHECEEGLPADECEAACLNAEDGPELLVWPKLDGAPTLAQIRQSYDCAAGK